MSDNAYIIGIDFGTTNCTMAYAENDIGSKKLVEIKQFEIPQMLQDSVQGNHSSLPSFIYYLLIEELTKKLGSINWNKDRDYSVGTFAKERGAEIPTRLISSAKSWLCHNGIDRREKILPIDFDDEQKKISPLEACSRILQHLRESWNSVHSNNPLEKQQILVTVPASFDPSARQLIQEAAQMVGYPEIVLLEEPQAAFYSWLYVNHENWRDQLKVGDNVLVIDIGGGTTDFSLINVEETNGNLTLHRQAVGSHLLLGGDNIDLTLAYLAKQKLEDQGHLIDSWQLQALVHQCRKAKEVLMGNHPPNHIEVTILGRGSKLIGNTLKIEITKEESEELILNGFFPIVNPQERSSLEKIAGIQQIGLPYVKDPRISSQLAKFLSMTGESNSSEMDRFILPTAVLFNGGTMKASAFRERTMSLLNKWAKELGKNPIRELSDADYDYAVSKGAVYYGLARQGQAIRIKSGTSRSYFVGVEEAAPAVPGISPSLKAICIVPFGMEEGEEQELQGQEFALAIGQMASFRFFSHATPYLSDGNEPKTGTIVRNWKNELTELHPIETVLEKGSEGGKTVKVKLKSKITELGMLELWGVASDGQKWKLEFNIRDKK